MFTSYSDVTRIILNTKTTEFTFAIMEYDFLQDINIVIL